MFRLIETGHDTSPVDRPRTFSLLRLHDETGVSGEGVVAHGVQWVDGTCALRWLTETRSVAIYDSFSALMQIHGHGAKTVAIWHHDTTYQRGQREAHLARCEGGRPAFVPEQPEYISDAEWPAFLAGYIDMRRAIKLGPIGW